MAADGVSRVTTLELESMDGHLFEAHRVDPSHGNRRFGAVVVLHDVFGLNDQVKQACARLAAEGHIAVAPALFDRIEPGRVFPFGAAGAGDGRRIRAGIAWDEALQEVDACIASVEAQGPVVVLGFGWGGSLAWLAGTRLYPWGVVAYSGTQIAQFKDEPENAPIMLHFSRNDPVMPVSSIEQIRFSHPKAKILLYDALSGFYAEGSTDHNAADAARAWKATTAFFEEVMVEGNANPT